MFTPDFRKQLVDEVTEVDRAAAGVEQLFTTAIEALALLYKIAPERAAALTRQVTDGFDNIRSQFVGS